MLAFEKIKEGRVPWEANKIAQMLIEQGHADVNEIPVKRPEYPTLRHALGEAAFYENVDFVEYLLDHGADPSIRPEKDGLTAWEIAVSDDGLPSVVDALVNKGISPATLWGILRP
jgi:ankyrin repeat protein